MFGLFTHVWRHGHRDEALRLAQCLGAACDRGVPVDQALLSALPERSLLRTAGGDLEPGLLSGWRCRAIGRTVGELRQGVPLGTAARRHLRGLLPNVYLRALVAMELHGQGSAAELNAMLADPELEPRGPWIAQGTLLLYAGAVLLLFLLVLGIILPLYERMFPELLGSAWPAEAGWAHLGVDLLLALRPLLLWVAGFALVAVVLLLLRGFCGLHLPEHWGMVEMMHSGLGPIPFVGAQYRDRRRLEAAHLLAVFLAGERPFPEALDAATSAATGYWLRERLDEVRHATWTGEDWAPAWRRADLSTDADHWLLASAARGEHPAEALHLFAATVGRRLARRRARLRRLAAMLLTFVTAAFVLIVALNTIGLLTTLTARM